MDLNWIKELIDILPETSIRRKNLIAIAGYPKWEIVNSNLLAFYFDEKEEHGFSRLFINSLFDIYETKLKGTSQQREIFETDFSVDREVATDSGRRIDLLLREDIEVEYDNESIIPNWAIIIENKLFADLYNDLTDYWKSVKADNKIGIVFSVNPIEISQKLEKKGVKFTNITHGELIEKVMQNLPEFYIDSDDRHLLFLKEYISNINSYYKDKNEMDKMDKTLGLFHLEKDKIKKFKEVDLELLKYVSKSVFEVMTEMGFPPYSTKDSSKGKYFYINGDSNLNNILQGNVDVAEKFRFWVNLDLLRYSTTFEASFELWGKDNTKHGDKLKNRLKKIQIFTENIQIGIEGKSGGGYQHIYDILIKIGDFTNVGFDNKLKKSLKENLFNHKNKFIEKAIVELKEIIKNE
ncbi:MAG: PD-(D/E)XK nuclease family protein [Bacteroidales bacterium]|nr:PD-(D/E)XK nuclease family protein [Bacteroidales bacterium]